MGSTVYKKIEDYLMDIIQKNFQISDYQLPSERALCATFNSSRKPVRRAYDKLIQQGLVYNIHGKGYFISSQAIHNALVQPFSSNPKIALIIPSVTSQFCHDILTGISDFCSSHQMELVICVSDNSPEKEARLLSSIPASKAKGIILFPVDHDETYHNEPLKLPIRKYPLVLVDRMLPNIRASFISSENHQAMVNAVEFLYKKGFQRIVYVTPPSSRASTLDARINGFTHGLLRYYKMATPQNLLVLDGDFQEMKESTIKYLQKYSDVELIIVSGSMRLPIYKAAEELNIKIPDDLKLMMFDDELSPTERNTLKPYVIKQDGYQIGYLAAESLYNQIWGDTRPTTQKLPVTIAEFS